MAQAKQVSVNGEALTTVATIAHRLHICQSVLLSSRSRSLVWLFSSTPFKPISCAREHERTNTRDRRQTQRRESYVGSGSSASARSLASATLRRVSLPPAAVRRDSQADPGRQTCGLRALSLSFECALAESKRMTPRSKESEHEQHRRWATDRHARLEHDRLGLFCC